MDYENEIKKIIFKHLAPNLYHVFLFGSRAQGRARKWSDYDIGLEGPEPLSWDILGEISAELEESDIPYKVDVVDFKIVSPQFKELAMKDAIIWTKPE